MTPKLLIKESWPSSSKQNPSRFRSHPGALEIELAAWRSTLQLPGCETKCFLPLTLPEMPKAPPDTGLEESCHIRLMMPKTPEGGREGEREEGGRREGRRKGLSYLMYPVGSCTGSHSPGQYSVHHSSKGCCNTHQFGHCRWPPCTQGCRCRYRNQSHPGTGHGGKDLGHSCRYSPHTRHQRSLQKEVY